MKKYNYGALDYESPRERSCYTVGRVYQYNSEQPKRGFINGDLLLCIRKSGDAYYDFVRIEKHTETSYSGIPTFQLFAYFKLLDKTSEYGGMIEAFPNMETLTELDLVHILYSDQVLIPLFATFTDVEMKEFEKKIELKKQLYNML